MVITITVLAVSIGVVFYTYALYPFIVAGLGYWAPRAVRRDEGLQPRITLIISAYNEEDVILAKLENAVALDYPRHLLEIIVASESVDGTNAIAAEFADRGIQLRAFDGRLGKSATLHRIVPTAASEIIVFSDANTMYRHDSLRKLARNFADPSVGCVIGQLVYHHPSQTVGGRGETVYWTFDRWQRRHAARASGLVPGINGGIFAIRKSLYLPFNEERGDDYELCTRIASRGHDVVFEPEAIAEERASETTRQQFRRKTRLVRWNIASSLLLIEDAIRCGNGRIAWQLLSHRLLRYTVPVWLLLALVSSAILARESALFAFLLVGQLAFYGVGVAGWIADAARLRLPGFCLVPSYFLMVNSAALVAILALGRGQVATWQKQR